MTQQPILDCQRRTTGVMHETPGAVFRHDTVAGNNEWNRIIAAGAADGAWTGIELLRQRAISTRLASRNSFQRLPYAHLMRRAGKQ